MKETETDSVVEQFNRGEIDRRSAVKALLGLGLAATSAYVALGQMAPISSAQAQGSSNNPKLIASQSEAMTKLVSRPDTVKKLQEIAAAPDEGAKIRLARDLAASLKAEASKTKELNGLRVTTRVFEPPSASGKTLALNQPDFAIASDAAVSSDNIGICVSSGPGGAFCVSYGT